MGQIKHIVIQRRKKDPTQTGVPCVYTCIYYIRYLGKYLHINGLKSTHSFNASVVDYDLYLKHQMLM